MFDKVKELIASTKGDFKKLISGLKQQRNLTALERAQQKFVATHEYIGEMEPSIVVKDKDGNKQYHTMNHTRKTGEKVTVSVFKFTGWDYGKRYTAEKLREIRRKQVEEAIKGQTHFTDGTPIIYSGAK